MHFSATNPLCSAAPIKATVGSQGLQLPLDSTVDAGAVIEMLFGLEKPCKDAPMAPKTGDMKQQKMKKNKKWGIHAIRVVTQYLKNYKHFDLGKVRCDTLSFSFLHWFYYNMLH